MKRNLLLILAIALSSHVFAQEFDLTKLRAGAGLVYATEIGNIGINFNGAYEITETWEAALGFTHIFEKDYSSYNILDLDGHYKFYQHDEKLNVYGLAGLGFTFWKVTIPAMNVGFGISTPEISDTGTEVGLNLGVGLNYKLTDNLNLAPEIRYTIMDGSYLRIGASVQYMF
jgi:opacity protein-like surface antigen